MRSTCPPEPLRITPAETRLKCRRIIASLHFDAREPNDRHVQSRPIRRFPCAPCWPVPAASSRAFSRFTRQLVSYRIPFRQQSRRRRLHRARRRPRASPRRPRENPPHSRTSAMCSKPASARATFNVAKPILLLGHLDTVWPLGTLHSMPCRLSDGPPLGPRNARHEGRRRHGVHRPRAAH